MSHDTTHSSKKLAALAKRIPQGTWDTHMHVVDPRTFPLAQDAQYQPSPHTMDQAQSFLGQLGIQKMVIVQPSIYGNDNACTLDGLRALGLSKGRAVIQFDPATTSRAQLQEWHDIGVRGVRLNFKSVGATPNAEDLERTLHQYADAVRDLGWVVQLYISIENIPMLESIVPALGVVKVCIDHIGHPTTQTLSAAKVADEVPGFASLLRLLHEGNTWVKLSGTYRLDKDPGHAVVEDMCRRLVKARPDRCVFATDWPHTRFEDVDVAAYLENILDWCEDAGVDLKQVLVLSAEELFDAKTA